MKKVNLISRVCIAALLLVGAHACSDNEKETLTEAQAQQKLILAALESDPELSLFTEAFRSIDLSGSPATGFTILALKNGAIEGEITADILQRHVLETAYTPSALTEAGTVTSLGGITLVVKITDGVVALNNTFIGTHSVVGNSTLYVLEELIPVDNTFLGLAPAFDVTTYKVARLRPEAIALDNATFEWVQELNGNASVVSSELDLDFITPDPGEYKLSLAATLPGGKTLVVATTITVTAPEEDFSPHPVRAVDFFPAPGANLNTSATREAAREYARTTISKGTGSGIYLGAFGGYLIVGYDHTIINRPGYCDFTTRYGGSNVCPSIIWVAYDANENGEPDDDEWYEIKGSEHGGTNDLGIRSYTYQTTKSTVMPTGYAWTRQPGNETGAVEDAYMGTSKVADIRIASWIPVGETFTLTGRELKPNVDNANTYKPILPFAWGYAGNQTNGSDRAAIDIDWAVDADGNSVHLPGVDFIKVVNAIQGLKPMYGEYRYQVVSIEDLHLQSREITPEAAQGS
jgi:hypothetical protein